MRTPFNEYWLELGATVPVDVETTAILLNEIRLLRDGAFNRGGWPEKKSWRDLSKEKCWDVCMQHRNDPFSLLVATQNALRELNGGPT